MKLCAAIRQTGSDHACEKTALPGCTLCLTHLRSRNVTLWSTYHAVKSNRVARIQALARGWLLRRRLALAGPGVLCRKELANQEDLETCEEASREYPMDYFAFEESGKVWWFHFPTLWRWMCRNLDPVNPYTKVPLSTDTRIRLRAMWRYKRIYESIPAEPNTEDRIRLRMNVVSQLLQDHGFGQIAPTLFCELSRSQWVALFRMVRDDLAINVPQLRIQRMTKRYIEYFEELMPPLTPAQFQDQASRVLFLILMFPKDPYSIAFTILSALYRV